jgi:hypothetical protein
MDGGIKGGEQGSTDGRGRSGQSGGQCHVSMHTSAILSFIIPRLLTLQGLNPSNAQLLGSHAAPLVPDPDPKTASLNLAMLPFNCTCS